MPAKEMKSEAQRATLIARSITSVVNAFFSLAKLALVTAILLIVWENRTFVGAYLKQWLNTATHVGFLGISVDRQLSAEKNINEISQRDSKKPELPQINTTYARGAIVRAARNAPAIVGARILWVDDHPDNNRLEEKVLNDIGIDVRRATSTKEALSLLPGLKPDLIISNIMRHGDETLPLHNCPAHYFEVPPGVSENLNSLNADLMAGKTKATGFSMAEAISEVAPEYTNHFQPKVIFYSASAGGISASQCARQVVNRVDLLLQDVVSALEEFRWMNLMPNSASQPGS
jgi:CheY-like chemotaxis protein